MGSPRKEKPRFDEKRGSFLTNKEAAFSGSIKPLRGNEEAGNQWPHAFEISVAGHVPTLSLAFGAKMARFCPQKAKPAQCCADLKQFSESTFP